MRTTESTRMGVNTVVNEIYFYLHNKYGIEKNDFEDEFYISITEDEAFSYKDNLGKLAEEKILDFANDNEIDAKTLINHIGFSSAEHNDPEKSFIFGFNIVDVE